MSAEREGQVERYLVQRVADLGGRAMKFVSPGASGVPDRVCFIPGRPTIFVEVKAPGEKVRPMQAEVLNAMASKGALVFVVNSQTRVEALLTEWAKLVPKP